MTDQDKSRNKEKWSRFYKNWKSVWRDPTIDVYEKAILNDIFLYRSDAAGWSISERKLASDLGIARETASRKVKILMNRGLVIGERRERKRGKLRLTGQLRSPDWVIDKSNSWPTEKSSKYQSKEQINNNFSSFKERSGKMEKATTYDEIQKRLQERWERGSK